MPASTLHRSESSSRVFQSIEDLAGSLGITDQLVEQRQAAIGLSSDDRSVLRDFWTTAEPECDAIVRRLYDKLRATPQLARMLQQETRVERLISLQRVYLRQLFCDPIDHNYVRNRLGIGSIHHQIRVTPQWYLLTYSHFFSEVIEVITRSHLALEERRRTLDAFQKSIFFDISLALDAYGHIEDHVLIRRRQQEAISSRPEASESVSTSPFLAAETGTKHTSTKVTRIRIDDSETNIRASFINLPVKCGHVLSHIRRPVEQSLEAVLARFYAFVQSCEPLAGIVPENQIGRLISQVGAYWREFLDGHFDRRHAASRMRIGVIHESIGLSPAWYVAGVCQQVSGILQAIPDDTPDAAEVLKTLFRGVLFDMTFVIDAYMEARAASLLEVRGFAQQLMAGLSSAVVIVGPHNSILFANESFLELTGIEPAMLYMMELSRILPQQELLLTLDQQRRNGQSRASCMTKWSDRIFRASFVRLQESNGTPLNSTAIVFDDVSDVVQLSENLELDSMQYKNLANAVTAVLWEMDWDTRTILSISHPAIDLTGHRDVYFLGRPFAWQNCIAACDRSRFEVSCEALSSSPQCICEYRMLKADGREIWIRSHLSRMRRGSQFVIAAISTDITRERESDHLRLIALEDVAAGLVNVVNNALTVINANLELENHARSHESHADRTRSEFLTEAQLAATRAAQVMGQLRIFAKGQFLRSRVISASEVLSAGLYSLQLQCGPLAKVQTHLHDGLWQIRTDPDQLLFAAGHLCENSRHALPSGGVVRIVTRNIGHEDLPPDDEGFQNEWIEVAVTDNGTGMTEDVASRAIEPFFTTSSSSDRLGLGLSMVHGFVSQSGGHMKILTHPGQGTSVTLRFPRYLPPEVQLSPSGPFSDAPVVLIVDSDESVRASTALLVNRLGFRSQQASSAPTAQKIASQHPIKALITDLPLHGGDDGITLARRIAETNPDAGIVLMTGSGSLDQLNDTVPDSWVILEKPFALSDLSQGLTRACQKPAEKETKPNVLSAREREVLQWVAAGKSQVEIAMLLHISERTVEQHVRNAKLKLNAVNTVQAVVDAIARGEISASPG